MPPLNNIWLNIFVLWSLRLYDFVLETSVHLPLLWFFSIVGLSSTLLFCALSLLCFSMLLVSSFLPPLFWVDIFSPFGYFLSRVLDTEFTVSIFQLHKNHYTFQHLHPQRLLSSYWNRNNTYRIKYFQDLRRNWGE